MRRRRLIVAALSALIIAGCATYRHHQAAQPETVRKTEAMLADAGFAKIKVDTSEQGGLVENLSPDEIRSYKTQSGTVYWYYDPDICSCVYEGHQNEFDRYQMALKSENDTAQYAAQSADEEVASLNALNGAYFPVPLFWVGGFPPGYYVRRGPVGRSGRR